MAWFGRKKQEEVELPGSSVHPEVDILLTDVTAEHVTLQSRRTHPLGVWLYLNVTAPTIENVRSTGLKIRLDETHRVGRSTHAYRGHLANATPALVEWLQQVRDQGLPNAQNASHYVSLHLDQRLEGRSKRQFQVMSPDLPGYKALTSDISRTGLRLQIPEEPLKGAIVRLRLVFDDFNFDDAEVKGEILWTMMRDSGTWWAGLRFTEMTAQAREAIDGYLRYVDGYKKKRFRGA